MQQVALQELVVMKQAVIKENEDAKAEIVHLKGTLQGLQGQIPEVKSRYTCNRDEFYHAKNELTRSWQNFKAEQQLNERRVWEDKEAKKNIVASALNSLHKCEMFKVKREAFDAKVREWRGEICKLRDIIRKLQASLMSQKKKRLVEAAEMKRNLEEKARLQGEKDALLAQESELEDEIDVLSTTLCEMKAKCVKQEEQKCELEMQLIQLKRSRASLLSALRRKRIVNALKDLSDDDDDFI